MILSSDTDYVIGTTVNSSVTFDPFNSVKQPTYILRRATQKEHEEFWKEYAKIHSLDFSSYYINPPHGPYFFEVSTD